MTLFQTDAAIDVWVPGDPVAKPAKRSAIVNGQVRVYTPKTIVKNGRRRKHPSVQWSDVIRVHLQPLVPAEPIDGPVGISTMWIFDRPKSHFGTGRNAAKLKPSAPKLWMFQKPDFDNLYKLLLDECTALRIWRDDCQICRERSEKRWCSATKREAGVQITIERLAD